MSKTVEEVGMIVGGLALAAIPGLQWAGVIAISQNTALLSAIFGIGLSTTLSGVGLALRQTPKPVGIQGSISLADGVSPRRRVYGRFQTAGVLTYASFPASQNLATTNQYLHLVYTLTDSEITSFDAVAIDGTVYNLGTDIVWDPSTGYWHLNPESYGGSSPPLNDFYWQHIFFEFDFGRNWNSQPFPQLAAADSSWTSACIQQGCAKVHVVLRADSGWTAVFPSGQIPNMQFLLTGKKLIDPRIETDWVASTAYPQFSYIVDDSGILWWQQTGGSPTSGSSRPAFESNDLPGGTLTDGGCTWYSTGASLLLTIYRGIGGVLPQQLAGSRLMNDTWSPGTTYGAGADATVIEAPFGYLQVMTTAGTTGLTRPNFAITRGATTTDGGATWTCLGRSTHSINPSNPALVVYDYLQDSIAGMGADASSIDLASVIAAANVCEEQVLIVWNADNTVVYEDLYSCNGSFDHSSVRGNVLTALCGSMAGWVVPPGDYWYVFAGAYVTPTIALTDDDLRGPIKGDFRLSKRDVANSIKGTYVPSYLPTNPAATLSLTQVPPTWHSQNFPPYQANGLAGKPNFLNDEDDGQIIWQDVQFDFCTSVWQAQRLAKITLMRLRFQETLSLSFKLTALALEAGDTFYFTHARWGIISATYQAEQCAISFSGGTAKDDAPSAGVDIVARLVDPSIYDFTPPSSSTNFGEYSPFGITGVMTGVE